MPIALFGWCGSRVFWPGWRSALSIVKPETVIAWHRQGFRLYWFWKSRPRQGRPPVSTEMRALIRRMSTRQSRLGCATHSPRVGQTRHPSLGGYRRQVQGAAPSASLADLAYLPEQSCETSRLGRFLCGSDRDVSAAVWVFHPPSPPSSAAPVCGHPPPDCGVDGPSTAAGVPLGQRSTFSGA